MTKKWIGLIGGLIVFLICGTAWAQGTAQISGTVKDQSGAVLPGVEITATQTATGIVRNAVSDETGSYSLTSLPVGPYRIEVALPGFRTYVQTGITLEVNANPVINATLEVGQVTEQVEVQANAALVETRTTGVAQIMEQERILELPLNGRNVTELILGQGAAVSAGTSSSRSMPNQQDIRVGGGQAGSVAFSLDGATHTNPYDNLSLPLPFPDALQEFKVETSALSASQGQHSGAQVNAVTKSGTNDYHGSLFEFVRNDAFNARQYFSVTQSSLKRNQFGGVIGGPIKRNKLFFFAGGQLGIIRSDPADLQRYIPTPAALAGDFTALASPACNNNRQLTLTPSLGFNNNRIDPALFSPAAVNLAKRLPQPLNACGLVVYGNQQKDNEQQWTGKVDWQANANHAVVSRVLFTGNKRTVPHELQPDNLLNTGGTSLGWDNLAQSYMLGDTWLLSPQTVASGRLSVNYTNVQRLGADFFNFSDIGVKNHFSYLPKYLLLTVSDPGFALGGGTQSDSTFRTFSAGLNGDISMSRGQHQFAYGGAFIYVDSNSNAHVQSPGTFSFSGIYSTLPMADFLLGRSNSYQQAAPNTNYVRQQYIGGYFADTWKVHQRWTLNYGVRWEPDLAEVLTLDRVQNYSDERRLAGVKSTVFTKAPAGFYYVGDQGHPGRRGRDLNWFPFAPRFGFAWDVNGDGKTSVRASAGIAYEKPNSQFHLWTSIAPPWGANVNLTGPVTFDDPWATYPGGNPFPAQYGKDFPFPAQGEFTTIPYDLIQPSQVQNWNLSVQRQLGADWLIQASYLGSHSIHMLDTIPLNPSIFVPGVGDAAGNCFLNGQAVNFRVTAGAACSTTANTQARRRLSLTDPVNGPLVGNLAEIRSEGTSSYNGLLLDVRKRAARGVTVSWNYTWAHCIGSEQDLNGGTGVAPNNSYTFPGDRERGRGNCSSDRRQQTNASVVAEMPQFANRTLRMVGSGWRLATIYRYQTGQFLNITNGNGLDAARSGTNVNAQPGSYIGGNPYTGTIEGNKAYFDRAAFVQPAVGTYGNLGLRRFRGPATWAMDAALSRSFQFKESHRVEVRFEAFNIPNSFRPNNPATLQLSSPQFGVITDAADSRILQFALKYVF